MTDLHVGIGQIVSTEDEDAIIEMVGLGSCAGIFICAPKKFAVAAHCLLAEPAKGAAAASAGRFVETAVPALLDLIRGQGLSIWVTKAYVVGGANVFSFGSENPTLDIGAKNVDTALDLLSAAGLIPSSTQTGGNIPRTAKLSVETGQIEVRTRGNVV
ncbi:MAG TPA: hypothetical protein ENH15_00160 [Actinobacteria bacterium]|nr:hypothetical protein [Actinomycetota bacterium]